MASMRTHAKAGLALRPLDISPRPESGFRRRHFSEGRENRPCSNPTTQALAGLGLILGCYAPRPMGDPRRLFRALGLLRALTVAGVGLSMAAGTGAFCGMHFTCGEFSNPAALCTALPTLLVGTVWAGLLRWAPDHRLCGINAGWMLSAPLAILNTCLCAGFLEEHGYGFVRGLASSVSELPRAVTIGMVFWVPALVAVLVVFGLPLFWARRQAERGLIGEELGDVPVGLVVVSISALSLVRCSYRPPSAEQNWLQDAARDVYGCGEESVYDRENRWRFPDSNATRVLVALGLLGVSAGATATWLAWRRDRARRRFVVLVEQGCVAGFRVVEDEEGRKLVRVHGTEDYRQVEEEEMVSALDGSWR